MLSWGFRYLQQSDTQYEKARCESAWNGCVPDRYSELIDYPKNDDHIQHIVIYAKDKKNGHRNKIRYSRLTGHLSATMYTNVMGNAFGDAWSKPKPGSHLPGAIRFTANLMNKMGDSIETIRYVCYEAFQKSSFGK
ncbi:FAD binding domain-containing protein [Penicillium cinerascens]|uniref:FAD binding domain-containing protein n=1 Tax=Penicillium cinerascens TaxID=70096 RepID=A0A9W9MDI5_9EURO|nr:FAD binding domain-containing protein [Penicillium cinerascens]KAJ5198475.1 FAD binding domain-containing protein [Penicillium cinerascens]